MADTGAPLNIPYVEANTLTPDVPLRALADAVNKNLLIPKGTWNSATAYSKNHVVIYNNAMYRANAANTNKTPGVDAAWDLWLQGVIGADGKSYFGTSTTSLAISTGSKTFTTQSGMAYIAGSFIKAVSAANSANYMLGEVTSYSGTTLIANITEIGGSGTLADWSFTLVGQKGATGNTGPTGSTGPKGDPFIINAVDVIANRGDYDSEDAGFNFLASDESKLYVRIGTSGWSDGVPFDGGGGSSSANLDMAWLLQ